MAASKPTSSISNRNGRNRTCIQAISNVPVLPLNYVPKCLSFQAARPFAYLDISRIRTAPRLYQNSVSEQNRTAFIMRVKICTSHEDDFFQCRVIAMVVLALNLNELFLLASHLLPVDPVYLFRHRITFIFKRYLFKIAIIAAPYKPRRKPTSNRTELHRRFSYYLLPIVYCILLI